MENNDYLERTYEWVKRKKYETERERESSTEAQVRIGSPLSQLMMKFYTSFSFSSIRPLTDSNNE